MNEIKLENFFELDNQGYIEKVGRAQVNALAYHADEPVVVYLSGATTTLSSIRATFNGAKAKLFFKKHTYGGARLKATKPLRAYNTRDDYLEEDHMLLLSEYLINPVPDDVYAYALSYMTDSDPTMSEYGTLSVGQRIKLAVTVPLLQAWYKPLIVRGLHDKRITRLDSYGCRVWGIRMDETYWEDTIQNMLKSKELVFPKIKNY